MLAIVEMFQNGIFMFMGFIMGIVFGVGFVLINLTDLLSSPIILGFIFAMTLIGIFFILGILKKDKIEQRRDIYS